ncbi:uncharacterized protein [Palaemon carinicauda]|uniref:uncharacterized protein n=1 Tax=Palaemon carinicauda TaxID=392227 RepID=UPI0035B65DBD
MKRVFTNSLYQTTTKKKVPLPADHQQKDPSPPPAKELSLSYTTTKMKRVFTNSLSQTTTKKKVPPYGRPPTKGPQSSPNHHQKGPQSSTTKRNSLSPTPPPKRLSTLPHQIGTPSPLHHHQKEEGLHHLSSPDHHQKDLSPPQPKGTRSPLHHHQKGRESYPPP